MNPSLHLPQPRTLTLSVTQALTLTLTLFLHLSLPPNYALVVDENMIPWKGNTGAAGLVPHLSYVKQKPEPLGVESKTVCDCSTGVSSLPSLFTFGWLYHFLFFCPCLKALLWPFLKADGLATFVSAMFLVLMWAYAIGTTFVSTFSGKR